MSPTFMFEDLKKLTSCARCGQRNGPYINVFTPFDQPAICEGVWIEVCWNCLRPGDECDLRGDE